MSKHALNIHDEYYYDKLSGTKMQTAQGDGSAVQFYMV